jgi:hypothetical protein
MKLGKPVNDLLDILIFNKVRDSANISTTKSIDYLIVQSVVKSMRNPIREIITNEIYNQINIR